jgi:nucleoside-diphosphate-sugar epimerase
VSTFFISGVTGFVGSALAATLAARGHRVIGSTQSDARCATQTPGVQHKVVLRLEDDLDAAVARGVDGVVHCAWDTRPGSGDTDVRGTQRLAETFHAAGTPHQLFISTYSAHPRAVTEYGTSKLAVQRYMLDHGHAVARLGLTIGAGGIYARMARTLAQHAVVPLIDGGRHKVPVLAIGDLTLALTAILEERLTGTFNLFNREPVPLREVLTEIRSAANSRSLLVPVPAALLVGPLWLARAIGLKLPLDVDNVRALRANDDATTGSDLSHFVPTPLTLAEMVKQAAKCRFM